MRMKLLQLASLVMTFSILCSAQHVVPAPVFKAIATEFSGENAQENDRAIVQYHRIQGSPMMASVAEKVVLSKLQSWKVESKIEQFPSDGRLFTRATFRRWAGTCAVASCGWKV